MGGELMAHNMIPWSPCYCDVCQLGHAKIIEAARRFWQLKDKPAAANACDTDDGPCACGAWHKMLSTKPCKHRIIGACELCVYDLRDQLADAKAVVEAARPIQGTYCEGGDVYRLLQAIADYDAKHGGAK